MGYFDKLSKLGFYVVCRRNTLGTTTMFAVRESDICPEMSELLLRWSGNNGDFNDMLWDLPEWRIVDFVGDEAAKGAELLYKKLTCTGEYARWDERILKHESEHALRNGAPASNAPDMLIGFEHRPLTERFQPIADEA